MESLEILMELIFQRYFQQTYCLTIISETNYDTLASNLTSVRLSNTDLDKMVAATEIGCSDYVIQVEDLENCLDLYKKAHKLSNTRNGDRKLILLPTSRNAASLVTILAAKELTYVPNLLLIIPKTVGECMSYELVTHRFVGRDEERAKDPILLDTWDGCKNGFERNANLFPHDLKNMHGKLLRIACFTYKPFTMLDLDERVTPGGKDGIELRIVEQFCRWLNCTIELVPEDRYQWGRVYPNGTGIGALGDVAEDRTDFAITSLAPWSENYKFMDFSSACYGCSVLSIVPIPRMLSRWELPLLAFSVSMWVTLVFMMIYATAALIFAQGCSTKKAWLITVGISLAQPQTYTNNWRVRSVLAGLIVSNLVINAAYSGGLASIFTLPNYDKSIDTIDDLLESGLDWGAPHDAWVYSLLLSKEPKIKALVGLFQKYPMEELERRSYARSMAYSIEKMPSGFVAVGAYITQSSVEGYQVMLEDFYFEYSVVCARKSSAYIGRMNELIGRLHETGILLAWDTQTALKYLDYKIQLAIKYSRVRSQPEVAALTFSHVMGVFMIHGAGIVVSTILFISEIMRGRKQERLT